ncbi:uncharacterized protein KGF55_002850 [Candida pseudojiufengensis]|uniref:uncharacterized protein n=1 Tax=Candida pseudojiufengensis TaxID=497109 RepID=UPI00222531E3|nr:uncharacterized protein KGF55_002850 [Candida pseudojiufengensis]KAI5963058.1 hypothetical protein KGF55_002850 [Candida pseudojiufengensis]
MTIEKTTHTRITRSRGGCLSCKKLRIKCNEVKPICEYCEHTGRECIYSIPKPVKTKRGGRTPKSNSRTRSSDRTLFEPPTNKARIEILDSSSSSSDNTSCTGTPVSFDPSSVLYGPTSPILDKVLNYNAVSNYRKSHSYPTEFDELTRTLILNQTSTMLGITKFELRLLKFFDSECIQLFSYGVNECIYNAWKYKVPNLFMQSDLVRQSIFAFSAIALSTTLELDIVQNQDNSNKTNFMTSKNWNHDMALDSKDNIYYQTTYNFLDTLSKASAKIDELKVVPNSFQDPIVAKELVVSSILIFSFLGVQPHKLIKLISFNKDEEEVDMIRISGGTRDTILNCSTAVANSDLAGLLFFRVEEMRSSPTSKDCGYPIINYLLNELYVFSDSLDLSFKSSQLEEIFKTNIDYLTRAMYGSRYYKFPIPLFRYLMVITEDFKDLLYKKHSFALKILFVYASLASIARFQMYNDNNIWRDHLIWYEKEFGLNSELERSLFHLVVDKHFMFVEFESLPFFDPIKECQN